MTNTVEGTSPQNKKHSKRFDPPVLPPQPPRGRKPEPAQPEQEPGLLDAQQIVSPDGRAFVLILIRYGEPGTSTERQERVAMLPAELAVSFANKLMHNAYEAENMADTMRFLISKGAPLAEVMSEVNSFGQFKRLWLAQQAAMARAVYGPQPADERQEDDAATQSAG